MRIIAGRLKGRALVAPKGDTTRPTADRVRQALFDMLAHAPWAGRALLDGAHVLDAFAGTGALGLEALSRGAAHATFIETNRDALAALRTNCRDEAQVTILPGNALRPPPGTPCGLVFLDPPYGKQLVPQSLAALSRAGWIAPGALIVAETGADEVLGFELLAERRHGAAKLSVWKEGEGSALDPLGP